MENISISTVETDHGYNFTVELDSKRIQVTCNQDYYHKLTHGNTSPEELIRASFAFLLEREPAESIMNEFDLPVISRYFPEYEKTMMDLFHTE